MQARWLTKPGHVLVSGLCARRRHGNSTDRPSGTIRDHGQFRAVLLRAVSPSGFSEPWMRLGGTGYQITARLEQRTDSRFCLVLMARMQDQASGIRHQA